MASLPVKDDPAGSDDGSKPDVETAATKHSVQPSEETAKQPEGEGEATESAAEAAETNNGNNAKEDEEMPLTFPQRLMQILSTEPYVDIISWLPHGKGFMIRDKKRFADEVLPHWFKKSKFTSFTRKLNRWNFVRVTRGQETGAYYHQMFLRDNPKLCTQMTCINSKSSQRLEPMNPVALGLGTGGQLNAYPDATDPAAAARLQEQRLAFFQHQWQQQQAFMAMMAQQAAARKEGDSEEKGDGEEGKAAGDGKGEKQGSDQPDAAAMAAFQQQQYYAMFVAQQQQMAAMAGMNPQQQQPFGFPPNGGIPGTGNASTSTPGDTGDKGNTCDAADAADAFAAPDIEEHSSENGAADKTEEQFESTTEV